MRVERMMQAGLLTTVFVASCSAGDPSAQQSPSFSSPTVLSTQSTVTSVVTVTSPTSSTTTPTSTTSTVSKSAIDSVEVEVVGIFCMNKVGNDLYQLEPDSSCSRGANFELQWTSSGAKGDVRSDDCQVVIDVSGPNDLNQRVRSGACSGQSPDSDAIHIQHVPGIYTINASITSSDGGAPLTASRTINILAHGS